MGSKKLIEMRDRLSEANRKVLAKGEYVRESDNLAVVLLAIAVDLAEIFEDMDASLETIVSSLEAMV